MTAHFSNRTVSRQKLGSVIRINAYVAFGQIARPDSSRSGPGVEHHANLNFLLRKLLPRLIESRIRYRNVSYIDIDSIGLQRNTGIADGSDNASPIRISSVDCGLHEGRTADRPADRTRPSF